jgi:hypothetical protein
MPSIWLDSILVGGTYRWLAWCASKELSEQKVRKRLRSFLSDASRVSLRDDLSLNRLFPFSMSDAENRKGLKAYFGDAVKDESTMLECSPALLPFPSQSKTAFLRELTSHLLLPPLPLPLISLRNVHRSLHSPLLLTPSRRALHQVGDLPP